MKQSYLENYKQLHQHPVNQVLHAIGIPMIALSLIGMFWNWKWGLVFFTLGWTLQFVGHTIEGKPPAFFKNPAYFFVGAFWWVKKMFSKKS